MATTPKNIIHQFNDFREKKRQAKSMAKGPVDLKPIRQEIKKAMNKFRRP